MAKFEIESYLIETVSRTEFQDRRVHLVSRVLSHGIQHNALLHFTSASDFPSAFTSEDAVGAATNVGGLNFNGISFFVWLRSSSFDEVIDILRNESPVFFTYGLREHPSSAPTTQLVVAAGISTDPETPGEGSPDIDAMTDQVIDSLVFG